MYPNVAVMRQGYVDQGEHILVFAYINSSSINGHYPYTEDQVQFFCEKLINASAAGNLAEMRRILSICDVDVNKILTRSRAKDSTEPGSALLAAVFAGQVESVRELLKVSSRLY